MRVDQRENSVPRERRGGDKSTGENAERERDLAWV